MQINKLQKFRSPYSKSKRIIKKADLPKKKASKSIKLFMKGKKTLKVTTSSSRIDSP